MRADLHAHSTASDGTLSPSSLVALALKRGLSVLAITDHDSVEGIAEGSAASRGTSLTLIPAVELSAVTVDGRDVHVLGYHIRPDDHGLLGRLDDLRTARLHRAVTMVRALTEAGFRISIEDVLELSDGGAVGRSHVARALVGAGHADTVADAFRRFIGRGRPFYVAKDVRTPTEAVACIRDAGGLAVLAHPGVNGLDDIIPQFVEAGIHGIEAYHADHTAAQRETYAAIAQREGLLVTGGSDYHGPDAPNPPLGSVDIPDGAVRALLEAGGAAL